MEDFRRGIMAHIGTHTIVFDLHIMMLWFPSSFRRPVRFVCATYTLATGSPDLHFVPAMDAEHRSRACADLEFETSNYRIKTTPSKEWMIVTGEMDCPEDQKGFNRRIPNIENLMSLSTSKEANLQKAEIIAIVLYTGPMVRAYFFLLNTIS